METITTAEQIGFISDCDVEYHIEFNVGVPGVHDIVRTNKLLGTTVRQSVSDRMMHEFAENPCTPELRRELILQNMKVCEWKLVDMRSRGRGV